MPPADLPDRGVLVLVTGTGRSGTSTIAGSLHHLGLEVPGPFLGANDSNPKGFFESKWAVRFHKRIASGAGIHDMDSRPGALERAHEATTPEMRAELVGFLRKRCAGHRQVVVKDPRSVWAQQLWREAAAEVGLEIRYLSMLRHPAEVIGSRSAYYATQTDEAQRHRYEIFNVARWVNNSLISERETRGQHRTFVRYTDLLEDWRPALEKVATELGLSYTGDLTPGTRHPVDDFIDPDLRRVRVTWDDLDVPDDLVEIAQGIWDQLMVLHAAGGADESASAELDALAARYDRLFAAAAAISHDAVEEARAEARAAGAREATRPETPTAATGRLVEETGGRDLLRVVVERAAGRLPGRRRGRA
ncbi:sulfotransferase family protein [Nocardioides donggukensis]|uniref:Sulfotransferase family protein n=1 Tax=Nocardioides donggukensis TaxID=2774019 RepID=A0A927Q2Z7_9ACTN|nr:sulfotransferase [Nocardioides donggukensis]MBD8870869.1 hypothetical protein [Nocardioides donggukensis]